MRSFSVVVSISLLALVALSGQTPAPASPPAAGPLRHLTYAFTVDTEGMSESQFSPITDGVNGVGSTVSSQGGRGTMMVDVLATTPDGALSVQISEQVQGEPRAHEAYTCTVYGDTSVVCPSVPAPSEAEWTLLSYLGRQFVDAAPWDANHHWQNKKDTPQYRLTEDFTLTDAGDGKPALIREHKKMEMHNTGFATRTEDVTIAYDRAMEVPDAIRDDMTSTGGAGSNHSTFDFHLSSDSMAKHAP